ncbi:Protein CBG03535 [Caenorhabditis briggsae]|uniref:Protein CBG03535 n=4 Tax=Caenorhabditis briggsae TaxID=6238 RepID=A8WVA3_CAEBR|nr:Protein CBG03535 [Caenorhabditis briggsae]CAP24414.2 Protein CBG03535 [Caenorhabditis briggsae]
MEILSFPDLILRRLLLTLSPSEVFLLSLTSSEDVKCLVKKNLYKAEEVWMEFMDTRCDRRVTFTIRVKGVSYRILYLGEMEFQEGEHKMVKWGTHTRYEFTDDTVLFYSSFPVTQKCIQLQEIHSYICNLFKCNPSQLPIRFDHWFNFRLLSPGSVIKSVLLNNPRSRIGYDDVNLFYKNQPKQSIAVLERAFWSTMKNDHALLKVPNVIIRHSLHNVRTFFLNFQGEHGLFQKAKITEIVILEFLKKWINKDMENLKTFIAYQHELYHDGEYSLSRESLKKGRSFEGAELEKWNQERFYSYNSESKMHRILLQSFHDVVNQEILRNMKPSEIFLTSMTSKKTKKLIKRNIYKVDEVGVKISRPIYEIRAVVYIKIGRKICYVVGLDFTEHQLLNQFVDWRVNNSYQFLENIVVIPSITANDWNWPATRRQIHSIHSYVCDVFNIDASNLSVMFPSGTHPECFDIGTVKKCTMTDAYLENASTIELFDQQKNMNLLVVESSREILDTGSKDYYRHIPTVIQRNAKSGANLLLTRFQGQHGLLENCFLNGFYVNVLMKMWSENKIDNLVSMIAYQSVNRPFDYEKVVQVLEDRMGNSEGNFLKALRVEKLSEKRIYPYESIITQEHQFEAGTFDCDAGYDVVRNSDGKHATIKISKDYFMFFVWP